MAKPTLEARVAALERQMAELLAKGERRNRQERLAKHGWHVHR